MIAKQTNPAEIALDVMKAEKERLKKIEIRKQEKDKQDI